MQILLYSHTELYYTLHSNVYLPKSKRILARWVARGTSMYYFVLCCINVNSLNSSICPLMMLFYSDSIDKYTTDVTSNVNIIYMYQVPRFYGRDYNGFCAIAFTSYYRMFTSFVPPVTLTIKPPPSKVNQFLLLF